jgi:P-type conjugative transfer protein TrbJ
MKKAALSIITSFVLVTASFSSGIPVVDVSAIAQAVMNYEQQIKDYANQVQQLQQQMQMVDMQTKNLKNLDNYQWDNLGSILYRQRLLMNNVNAISYDAGNVSSKFESTYKDFNGYSSDYSSASNQATRNQAYSERYRQITESNQNTLKGTLQKLELSSSDLDSESSTIEALRKRANTAEGNLQVLQANNDMLAYLVDEIRKLRVTMMDQTNAIANYMAAQNNKEILQQSRTEAFLNKDTIDNPFEKSADQKSFLLGK